MNDWATDALTGFLEWGGHPGDLLAAAGAPLDASYAAWPLWALAAMLAAAAALTCFRQLRWGTWVWVALFAAFDVFLAVWVQDGLVQVTPDAFGAECLVLAAVGVAASCRDALSGLLSRVGPGGYDGWLSRSQALFWARDAVLLVLVAVAANFALERTYFGGGAFLFPVENFLFCCGLALVAAAALYFLGQRRGGLALLVVLVWVGFGLGEYFVQLFKDAAMTPSDLLALGTAAAVAGGYTYTLLPRAMVGLTAAMVACGLLSLVAHRPWKRPAPWRLRWLAPKAPAGRHAGGAAGGAAGGGAAGGGSEGHQGLHAADVASASAPVPAAGRHAVAAPDDAAGEPAPASASTPDAPATWAPGGRGRRIVWRCVRVALNLACAAACAAGTAWLVLEPDYEEEFDFTLFYWDLRNSYHDNCFPIGFIAAARNLVLEEPQGYSDELARDTIARYAAEYDERTAANPDRQAASDQFGELMPSIVAIMNETYSDLSAFEDLHAGYNGVYVDAELADEAGTALAGLVDVSVMGGGTCNSEFEFLVGSSLGLVGPGSYPFQEYDLSGVESLPAQLRALGYHTSGMHPNEATNWSRDLAYAEMGFDDTYWIEDFEGARYFHSGICDEATYDLALQILQDESQPQFIFDVTMQNHGGYEPETLVEGDRLAIDCDFADETETGYLSTFLPCIEHSDYELYEFLQSLTRLDRPVVVVFFGDHMPGFARSLNDALYPGEPEGSMAHETRIRQTPYVVWANYDIAGCADQRAHDVEGEGAGRRVEAVAAPSNLTNLGDFGVMHPGYPVHDGEGMEAAKQVPELVVPQVLPVTPPVEPRPEVLLAEPVEPAAAQVLPLAVAGEEAVDEPAALRPEVLLAEPLPLDADLLLPLPEPPVVRPEVLLAEPVEPASAQVLPLPRPAVLEGYDLHMQPVAEGEPLEARPGEAMSQQRVERSLTYLAARMLQVIGAPLTDYQKALMVVEHDVPSVTSIGYRDAEGTWRALGDADEGEGALYDLSVMHYFAVSSNFTVR